MLYRHAMDNFHEAKPSVIATPDVWLEGEALRQLEQTASDPDCITAVGMPDLHPGPGIPIGAAFGFAQTIHPRLVGSDAGCGALVVVLGKVKLSSAIERRVRSEFEDSSLCGVDAESLVRAVWLRGASGLWGSGVADAVDALVELLPPDDHTTSGEPFDDSFASSLGTIGGGNHFAEIGRVVDLFDESFAEQLGLRKGGLVVLCHSGSRGLGKAIADTWCRQVLRADGAGEYLAALAGAIRFARANRLLVAWRVLKALGAARRSKIVAAFDVVHNDVGHEHGLWVHRKGCAPARVDQPTIVLGSRGARSWIMRGRGNRDGLSSVAHGAGRKMRRSEARDKIRLRYRRAQLAKSSQGGIVICDDTRLLYEEHPDAYKPIAPIIESLVQARLADRVAAIEPLLTVKK